MPEPEGSGVRAGVRAEFQVGGGVQTGAGVVEGCKFRRCGESSFGVHAPVNQEGRSGGKRVSDTPTCTLAVCRPPAARGRV